MLVVAGLQGCAAPPASCQLQTIVNVPVTFVEGEPTVMVTVSGHEFRFMIDTGAQNSVLTPEALGVLNAQARFVDGFAVGVGGRVSTGYTQPGDFKLDGLRVEDEQFFVNDLFEKAQAGTKIDGLLGDDILEHYNLAFDFPHNRFRMFLRGTCPATFPFKGQFADVPVHETNHGAFNIPVTIDNRPVDVELDTGAVPTVFDTTTLQQAGVRAQDVCKTSQLEGIGGKETVTYHERFASVTIGGEEADGAVLEVIDRAEADVPFSVLGEDYLRHHQVYISEDTAQVWLGLRIDTPAP
jgi:predicted aspartyl protease